MRLESQNIVEVDSQHEVKPVLDVRSKDLIAVAVSEIP